MSCAQEAIRNSIASFRNMRACINAKGGHFEHTLQNGLVNLVIDIF